MVPSARCQRGSRLTCPAPCAIRVVRGCDLISRLPHTFLLLLAAKTMLCSFLSAPSEMCSFDPRASMMTREELPIDRWRAVATWALQPERSIRLHGCLCQKKKRTDGTTYELTIEWQTILMKTSNNHYTWRALHSSPSRLPCLHPLRENDTHLYNHAHVNYNNLNPRAL